MQTRRSRGCFQQKWHVYNYKTVLNLDNMTKSSNGTALKMSLGFASILFLFTAFGYITTPADARQTRQAVEWPLSYGALGFGTAICLATAFLLLIKSQHSWSNFAWLYLQFTLVACLSILVPGTLLYLCSTIGSSYLFSGDSGAAIFVMTERMAMMAAAMFFLFPLFYFIGIQMHAS